jgi:hypothetical protein
MYEETQYRYKIENLASGENAEYELPYPLRPVNLLPVPYVSQLDAGATSHQNDCGPASSVMLIEAYTGIKLTPDEFYANYGIGGDKFLSAGQLRVAMSKQALDTDWLTNLSLTDIFSFLYLKKPFVALIQYAALSGAGLTESNFGGPHFLVVIGVDSINIYVHDPLYHDRGGEAKAYPLEKFLEAWVMAGQVSGGNPERAAIVPKVSLGQPLVRRAKINVAVLNVRSGPGLVYSKVGRLMKGEIVEVGVVVGSWGEIGPKRWIHLGYTVPA